MHAAHATFDLKLIFPPIEEERIIFLQNSDLVRKGILVKWFEQSASPFSDWGTTVWNILDGIGAAALEALGKLICATAAVSKLVRKKEEQMGGGGERTNVPKKQDSFFVENYQH